MSWEALGWAASRHVKRSADKLVLIGLADRHNSEEAVSRPSIAWLAEFGSLDRKTVVAALSRLEEAGLIADSGKRYGQTKQVKGWSLALNSTEKGVPKTEPLEAKSTVFPMKESQKRDTEPFKEPITSEANASSVAHAPRRKAKSESFGPPEGVSEEQWRDFLAVRKAKRAPMTPTAYKLMLKTLKEGAERGYSASFLFDRAVGGGWQTIHIPDSSRGPPAHRQQTPDFSKIAGNYS